MNPQLKATRLWPDFFALGKPQIRTFHMTWLAFFLCFFSWFGIAPLMPVVREELGLTKDQVGWCIIASVAITILARLLVGWLCDRIGPRLAYTWLLTLGSLPVMAIGLAQNFESFLFFRLLIGVIGAAFVITQYHTSVMFAPNIVGTANATTAGWGNLGGGVTQFTMPAIFALFVSVLGFGPAFGWRASMVVAGAICFLAGIAYYFLTQDTPEGNFKELRASGKMPAAGKKASGAFLAAASDPRVWALAILYGGCFGLELTIKNIAALYFADYFGLGLFWAGMTAGLYGLMNLFARTLGGIFSDRFGGKWGLQGRVMFLFLAIFCEGLALMLFSQMRVLALAIPALMFFAIFVQMSAGATYAVVPFVNKKSLGAVAGIVGAGGNLGAVAAGFLFKGSLDWQTALLILGGLVVACSFAAFFVRFSSAAEGEAQTEYRLAQARHQQPTPSDQPLLEPAT